MHGLLDYLPHAYPINSVVDVVLSLALISIMLLLTERGRWLLLGVCFIGAIFPDLVDLGPAIVNIRLGWSLPVFKIFPWHWREYSGSIYDGSRGVESFLYHLIVAGGSLALLVPEFLISHKYLIEPEPDRPLFGAFEKRYRG